METLNYDDHFSTFTLVEPPEVFKRSPELLNDLFMITELPKTELIEYFNNIDLSTDFDLYDLQRPVFMGFEGFDLAEDKSEEFARVDSSSSVSKDMLKQLKIMESGSENPKTRTATVASYFGETFATGVFGMTRRFDEPGEPAIKKGTTYSLERWNNILNAFVKKRAKMWKLALQGKSNVTLNKIDALVSISFAGNWATPNGWFGKFVIANWDNPEKIYSRWLTTGTTAAGNGRVLKGLVRRRLFEANWFIGNKRDYAKY